MPWLTQLDDIARRTGFPVSTVSGWQTRGHGPQPEVRGIVCHHTAGPASGDAPSLRVVTHGRPGLDGPLSHFVLARSGRIHVVAAGRCWHNAPSTSAAHDNSSSIGIEAENTGLGQPWPDVQLRAYERLCAELCRAFRLPATAVKAHREVNTQKIDPRGISMTAFRAEVARLIRNPSIPKPSEEDDPMPEYVAAGGSIKEVPPGVWTTVPVDSDAWKNGPFPHVLDGWARVNGYAYAKCRAPEGTEVQVRVVETEDGGSKILEAHPWGEAVAKGGSTPAVIPVIGDLQDKRDLRVQVEHWASTPVDMDVTVRLHYWKKG